MQYELLGNESLEFSVSELSSSLKMIVEDAFSYVKVRGEISGFKVAPSGHIYMNLKDEGAVLSAVCWRGNANKFKFIPEDGIEVVCTGKITTYAGQSKYQLIIESMEAAGTGALMELLEKRKNKLAEEGLFDEDRKKQIPFLPDKIGVITSPTGAVIKDILHRIEDRFPSHVMLWPCLVQGEKASSQVTEAIKGFHKMENKPNVIIVARGGGSLEDLWAFNEENVVRAAYESEIPIISAIGHETDTTLIDYAADLRAPTPTAAAEMAVPVKRELELMLYDLNSRGTSAANRILDEKKNMLTSLVRALPNAQDRINESTQLLDSLVMRLQSIFTSNVNLYSQKLEFMSKLLDSYDYKKVLKRGYAIVRQEDKVIRSATEMKDNAKTTLEFHDGNKAL